MSDLFDTVFGQSLSSLKVKNLDSASLHEIITEFAPLLTGDVIPIAKKAIVEIDRDIESKETDKHTESVGANDYSDALKNSPEAFRSEEGCSVNENSHDETDSCGPVDIDSVKSEEIYKPMTDDYTPMMIDEGASQKENQPDKQNIKRVDSLDCISIKNEPEDLSCEKPSNFKTTNDGALDLSLNSSKGVINVSSHTGSVIKIETSNDFSIKHSINSLQNHSNMPFQDIKPKLNIDSIPLAKKPKLDPDILTNEEVHAHSMNSLSSFQASTMDHLILLKNGHAKGPNGLDNFFLTNNMNVIKITAPVPKNLEINRTAIENLGNVAKAQLRGIGKYKLYNCEICSQVFDSKYHLNRHMMLTHEGVDPFVCEVCSKVFAQKCDLTRHMNIHLNIKRYFCKVCNKSFKRADYLAKHEKEFCSVFRPHKCEKCGRCYATDQELKDHVDTHEIRLAYKCDRCDDCFQEESDLQEHKKQHQDDKPQDCPLCSRTFPDFKDFVNHYREHSGERPYTCALCSKVFTRNHNLMTHLWIHNKVKSHMCLHCNKTFTYYSNLQVHLRVHTGERPYACGDCNKSFLTSSDLRRHHRTHSGDKPYMCKICKTAFTRKERLMQHKAKEHH